MPNNFAPEPCQQCPIELRYRRVKNPLTNVVMPASGEDIKLRCSFYNSGVTNLRGLCQNTNTYRALGVCGQLALVDPAMHSEVSKITNTATETLPYLESGVVKSALTHLTSYNASTQLNIIEFAREYGINNANNYKIAELFPKGQAQRLFRISCGVYD